MYKTEDKGLDRVKSWFSVSFRRVHHNVGAETLPKDETVHQSNIQARGLYS